MDRSPLSSELPVSSAIVERIADLEGLDPVNIEVPLYDVIDPEALDALTTPDGKTRDDVQVDFSYMGYAVTVDGRGTVDIA